MPTHQQSAEQRIIGSEKLPDFGLDYSIEESVNRHTMDTITEEMTSRAPVANAVDLRTMPLLSMQETARALKVSSDTLYRLIGSNKLRTITIGKRRLVTPWALQKYITERERITELGGNYGCY